MDHLMPGMDGFQAVQAIKGNPDTAVIPVVMYTSQEGELYLSQARALGAVGVLPKTVKHADVSRVLYQLHLLPDRRDAQAPVVAVARPANDSPISVRHAAPEASMGELEAAVRRAIAPALKEQNSELRRFVLAGFEAFAKRIIGEIKTAAAAPAGNVTTQVEVAEPVAPAPNRWPWIAGIVALAVLPAVLLAILYVRTLDTSATLARSNANLATALEGQRAQLAALQQTMQKLMNPGPENTDVPAAAVEAEPVPYGEAPLAGSRTEHLRMLVEQLDAEGFRGKVTVAAYTGDFCLAGSGVEGYSVAPDDLPAKRCDVVGNPFDDNLNPAQRQSLAFANLVSSLRQRNANSIAIDVIYEGRKPSTPYPHADDLARLSAGEWNRIAQLNNRVEFVVVRSDEVTE
jgi:CheY-like chemotaxis protein